jgi:GTP-binding protein
MKPIPMQIKNSQFERSVPLGESYWDENIPQIVFYGRSNAGKSSTINAVLDRNQIAKVSGTPGKTRMMNFYLVNNSFYVVDSPGYGYAKISFKERDELAELIDWYIGSKVIYRKSIIIMDAGAGMTAIDRETIEKLLSKNESVLLLINKIDKLNQSELSKIRKDIDSQFPDVHKIYYSARTKKGLQGFWDIVFPENI